MRGFFVPCGRLTPRSHTARSWEMSPTGSADGLTRGPFFSLGLRMERRPDWRITSSGPGVLAEQQPFDRKSRALETNRKCANGQPFESQLPQLYQIVIGPAYG